MADKIKSDAKPYTAEELGGLLYLWSNELNEIANTVQGSLYQMTEEERGKALKATPVIDKVTKLKLRRVSKEIRELLKEDFLDVQNF